jgi:flagellar biosynthesis protein FlhF
MQYFTEQAPTRREALERVRAKYGNAAQIVSHKTIRTGGFLGLFAREGIELTGYVREEEGSARKATAGQDEKEDLEERKRRILTQAKSDQAIQSVLVEVKKLRETFEESRESGRTEPLAEHPSLTRVRAFLRHNEFSAAYEEAMLARVARDFSLEKLADPGFVETSVVGWIREGIGIWSAPTSGKRRIFILVGPTGVGKTTTIAKLAAIHSVGIGGEKREPVQMITIDNYRIGARQQIQTYGDIMGVPVSGVETADDLYRALSLCQESGLILVDTIGKSPGDLSRLADMQRVIAACGPEAEVHLAISATMKTSDMERTLDSFSVFGYRAVVLTKVDETARIGNAISALGARKVPLSYITTGQRVPQDIERARSERLAERLERPAAKPAGRPFHPGLAGGF